MSASVILSILALYTSGFLLIITGLVVLRKFENTPSERCLGYGLLSAGLILGPFMGTRTIFGIKGYHGIDAALSVSNQVFMMFSFVVFGMYFSYKMLGVERENIIKNVAFIFGSAFFIVFVYSLATHAYTGPHITKWGTEYRPTGVAKWFVFLSWMFLIFLNFSFLVRRVRGKIKKRRKELGLDFYVGLILFVYLTASIFEELAGVATWKLVFSRVTGNAFAVSLYLLYTKDSFKKENL